MNDPKNSKTADPAALQATIRSWLQRAEQGDRTVLNDLRALLDVNAPLWQKYGDLASIVEAALVQRASGDNLLMAESTTRKLAEMKAELVDPSASALEKLLVARLVYCWLETVYLDGMAAQATDAASPQLAWLRRYQEGAQRRFLAATKALGCLRKMLRVTPSPIQVATRLEPTSAVGGRMGRIRPVTGVNN